MRRALLLSACVLLAGCTSMLPDRKVETTIDLRPGESVRGEVTAVGGERTLVAFVAPRDHAVQIAFLGDPLMGTPSPLGYAHQWIEDDDACHVSLTNLADTEATVTCTIKGPGDVRFLLTPLPPPLPPAAATFSAGPLDPVLQ